MKKNKQKSLNFKPFEMAEITTDCNVPLLRRMHKVLIHLYAMK